MILNRTGKRTILISFLFVFGISICKCEIISIFYQIDVPQLEFAAGDILKALESKGLSVEIKDLSQLTGDFNGKKVVLALANNTEIKTLLTAQGGSDVTGLGEQAYALRTTANPYLSYWVLGGDENGAMYGGLQIAEYISFKGFNQTYNEEDTPYLKQRGVKFNIPLDKDSPTYFYGNDGTSHKLAIRHVWDIDFWKTWFDEMARHRYNVLSLWSPHPFTSMVNMEDEYPGIAINGVTGYNIDGNEVNINNMTIDDKIEFWRQVMKYGRERGFGTYFCTWNIFLSTAEDKHGLTDSPNNLETRTYLRKCMKEFLETYPDLAGFGITVGERMGSLTNVEKEEWAWDTYGKGMLEYAQASPERDLIFIHRQHQGNVSDILNYFQPLRNLSNVRFDLSFKYSQAHAHAAVKPGYWDSRNMENGLGPNNLKSWLTIRNDDYYFLHWADPQFVRDYVNNFPEVGKFVDAFYIGADGWVFTKVFTSKDSYYEDQNMLSIQRTWYMQKLWGRISYNPNVSDELLKNHLAYRYQEVSSEKLFNTWSSASKAIQLANEQVTGTWDLDYKWWPEGWTSSDGFLSLGQLSNVNPMSGSDLCNIQETANNNCSGKTTAWDNAQQIEQLARDALSEITKISPGANTELKLNLKNLEAMCYLGLYNAYKIRAAIYLKKGEDNNARDAVKTAYCFWRKYTDIMDELFIGVDLQRNRGFSHWHVNDQAALLDFTNLGGVGEPNCTDLFPWIYIKSPGNNATFMEPGNFTVEVEADAGANTIEKVELNINGSLYNTIVIAPFTFEIEALMAGNYLVEAKVVDGQGNSDSYTITIVVNDPAMVNTVPWIEDFTLANGSTESKNRLTTWIAERPEGSFSVQDERFVVNDGGAQGVFQTDPIDISGGPVDVSLDVAYAGGIDIGQDFIKFYKKVDGGTEELMGLIDGKKFSGVELNSNQYVTLTEKGVTGSTLQLIIKGYVTYNDEYYFLDNLRVTRPVQLVTIANKGSVVLNPAGGTYDEGTIVTATAVPGLGYQFGGWSGDLSGMDNPVSITMNSDKEIEATFTEIPTYTLNISAANGEVTIDPSGGVYNIGTFVSLTPVADKGYVFESWGGDLSGKESPVTITMDSNKEISASFEAIPVSSVSIDDCPLTIMETGQVHQLTVMVFPENALDQAVSWSSSNENVASVDENGLVSALSQGSATITVITNDGDKSNTCNIGVILVANPVSNFSMGDTQFVEIYPNPTSDYLKFIFSESVSEKKISFYNTLGYLLNTETTYDLNSEFDIRAFSSSEILIVKVITNEAATSYKVILRKN